MIEPGSKRRYATSRSDQRVKAHACVTIIGGLAGLLLSQMAGHNAIGGLIVGLLVAASLVITERIFERESIGRFARHMPLPLLTVASLVCWVFWITLCLQVATRVVPAWYSLDGVADAFWRVPEVAYFLGFVVLGKSVLNATRLVDPRQLANFLLGRDVRIVVEQRTFLLADLLDFSAQAERLGVDAAEAYLQAFFEDLVGIVDSHGGEVWRTIGDKLIATWPVLPGYVDHRPIWCGFSMQDRITSRAEFYRSRFGEVPSFHVALHSGPVGIRRRADGTGPEAFAGDAFDASWELERETRPLDIGIVTSAAFLALAGLPNGVLKEDLGEIPLPKSNRVIHAFSLTISDLPQGLVWGTGGTGSA